MKKINKKQQEIDLLTAMILKHRDDLNIITKEMIYRGDMKFAMRAFQAVWMCRSVLNDVLNETLERH